MRRGHGLTVVLALTLAGSGLCAETGVSVLTASESHMPDFGFYNVKSYPYTANKINQTIGTEVEDDLARSAVLSVSRGGKGAAALLLADEGYRQALRQFLARGGVILFDYNTYSVNYNDDFLESVGVTVPGWCEEPTHKYYGGQLTDDGRVLGETPNKPEGPFSSGYGGWIEVPAGMKVLARMSKEPGAAVLLEQTGVAGKGRVLFSQLSGVNDPRILQEGARTSWSSRTCGHTCLERASPARGRARPKSWPTLTSAESLPAIPCTSRTQRRCPGGMRPTRDGCPSSWLSR